MIEFSSWEKARELFFGQNEIPQNLLLKGRRVMYVPVFSYVFTEAATIRFLEHEISW